VSSLESLINERATNKDFFWILLLRLPIYFWDFFGFFFFFFVGKSGINTFNVVSQKMA